MDRIPGAADAPAGEGFDPRQAAALLDQATAQARRTFTPLTPLLWTVRAVVALVVFGGCWLSVRGQHPYTGHLSGVAVAVALVLVPVNIGFTAVVVGRAGAGVSGPAQRKWQAWLAVMAGVWLMAYAFTSPLYHAGASHPVWGLYPASTPLLIGGLGALVAAAACRYWLVAGAALAIAVVAAAAGFGGPAGSWLILGAGLCAVCLGTAAFTAWRQRRSMVRP
jgi:hypothetical protein